MEIVYGIPILGVIFQFIGYVIDVTPGIAPIVLGLAAPIALGALCGVMNERSGIVNIGIEGMMLSAAFAASWPPASGTRCSPLDPWAGPFAATPALLIGIVAAILTAMALSALHAWLSISIGADQIISGVIINVAAIGLTGYLNRLLISPNPRIGAGTFETFRLPQEVVDIPVIGWILEMFIDRDRSR